MVTGTQQQKSATKTSVSKLIDLLNERLSYEYDAIIMYGIYSQGANRAVYRPSPFWATVSSSARGGLASQPLRIATATAMIDCTLVKWFEEYPQKHH